MWNLKLNCLWWKKCVKFDWEIGCWAVKDRKGNQSLKSCGLWLPGGVTWSGFACGGRRSSMWAVQLFLSGELVRAVVFEAGAPWCWWRCSLFACALHLTQLCFGMGCAVVPVAARILEQKVKQALALPARCSWHIYFPLQRPPEGFWVFLMLFSQAD